jgi:uncharacterized membrane protein YhaH (DUF805 family)
MPNLRAVQVELAKSFDFAGRTARSTYLCFLGLSVLTFSGLISICMQAQDTEVRVLLIITAVTVFYVPVTSAGVRRLHDVGESGLLMLDPLKPLAALGLFVLVIWLGLTGTVVGGVAGIFSVMFFGSAVKIIAAIAGLVALFIAIAAFSRTMGLLFLSSHPGPNKYGPEPTGVAT